MGFKNLMCMLAFVDIHTHTGLHSLKKNVLNLSVCIKPYQPPVTTNPILRKWVQYQVR